MTISIDDLLNTHGMGTSGNQNAGRLIPKTARLTVAQPTANVVIPPILSYSSARDILLIYINQRALAKDVDYSILSDEKTIQRKGGTFDAGTTLDFLLVTNIKTDIPTFDGSLLAEGSVVEAKLAKEVRDKLDSTSSLHTVYEDIEMLESKTRMMREVSANTQLLTEAGDLVASGTTFGGNGGYEFGAKPDQANTKTKVALSVGVTDLTGKVDAYPFESGHYITIFDDVNMEDVLVLQGNATTLVITPTTKTFKVGASLRRSTMVPVAAGKGYTFPSWNGVPLNKGTLRFPLGWTDEAILWATRNDDLQAKVKANYIPGDGPIDILGTTKAGTEIVGTNKIGESAAVDLAKSNYYEMGYWVYRGFLNSTNDPAAQFILDFAIDSQKNVIVVNKGNIGQTIIEKVDVLGKSLWKNTELGKALKVAVAPDDTIYVVYDLPNGQKFLRRLSASGTELWSVNRTAAHGNPTAIATCPNGDVVIAFSTTTGQSIQRYSSTGAFLWGYVAGEIVDMKTDVAGFVVALKKGGDLYRLKPDGQLHWVAQTTPYGNESCITVDRQGNTIVGYISLSAMKAYFNKSLSEDAANPSRMLKKYNTNGTLMWDVNGNAGYTYQYPGFPARAEKESVRLIASDTEGNITINTLGSSAGNADSFFIKFDPNGKILMNNQDYDRWGIYKKILISPDGYLLSCKQQENNTPDFIDISERDVNTIYVQGEDMELGASQHHATDSKNNVYVVRRSDYTPWQEMEPKSMDGPSYLVKYDKDGREQWRKRYGYTVHQVCVDEFDHVYIGTSGGNSLIKMDGDGTTLWSKSYYQHAFAVTAMPGGGCVVGYRTCILQRISATGNVLVTNNFSGGMSFYDGLRRLRSRQPRKFVVDSKKNIHLLLWPYDVFHFTENLVQRSETFIHKITNPNGGTSAGGTYTKTPILDIRPDIAVDDEDNFYYIQGSGVSKHSPALKQIWSTYFSHSIAVGADDYLMMGYQTLGIDKSGTLYATSSSGTRKFDKAGNVKAVLKMQPESFTFDNEGNFYIPNRFFGKYGRLSKVRSWTVIEDNKTWFIRTIKSTPVTLTIRIQSGDKVVSESVTIAPGENYRYALLPEKFLEGLNVIRFSFDTDGYEEWQVTRTSESLAVTQFLTTRETPAKLDVQLDLVRGSGSRSILHKYLGGIG